MRDAFNAIASRIMLNRANGRPDEEIFGYVKEYKEYAKEFLGLTNILDGAYPLNFNKWVDSALYRKSTANDLKLKYTDVAKNRISKIGGGSSWDKTAYDKRANHMDLSGRWKNFKDNDIYKQIFRDLELVDFSNKIKKIRGTNDWVEKN